MESRRTAVGWGIVGGGGIEQKGKRAHGVVIAVGRRVEEG